MVNSVAVLDAIPTFCLDADDEDVYARKLQEILESNRVTGTLREDRKRLLHYLQQGGITVRQAELLVIKENGNLSRADQAELAILERGLSEYYANLVRLEVLNRLSEENRTILDIRRKMDEKLHTSQ